MAERSDKVLWYSRKPSSVKTFFAAHRRLMILVGVFAVVLFVGFRGIGPTSGQIRLDTGDLRYCWWGIPLYYKPMPEPWRSKVMTLASEAPAVPAKWVTCVTYPLPSSNNSDIMCADFYFSVALWADEDPKIARWAMDDLVNSLDVSRARPANPSVFYVLGPFVVDTDSFRVCADWRDREDVKVYCSSHGYVPASTSPATGPRR
jgi:hypothetical protein